MFIENIYDIESLKKIFEEQSEEHNRALSIIITIIYRIHNEIMPDIEKIIKKNVKSFIFSKKINKEEKLVLLRILCQVPIYKALTYVQSSFKERKADKICNFILLFASDSLGITFEDILELEKIRTKNESLLVTITFDKICNWLNFFIDPASYVLLSGKYYENSSLIVIETVKVLCEFLNDDLLENIRRLIGCK